MQIFPNTFFTLVLVNIIKDSLDYIWSRSDWKENKFHTENQGKCNFCGKASFGTFSASHLIKLFISFSISEVQWSTHLLCKVMGSGEN